MEFWFCLKHMKVEATAGCAHAERMGPYATSDEAANAMKTAREKSEAWDRDDDWGTHGGD